MFIRQVKKQRSKTSKVFYQYTLAQAARVDGKVKQRAILYLGSDKLLEDQDNRKKVLAVLKSKIFKQSELFPQDISEDLKRLALQYYQKYCIKYEQYEENPTSIPPQPKKAEFHNVDIKGLEVENVKEFGAEYLCKQILDKLKLEAHFKSLGMSDETTKKALISIAAKAIYSASEHKTSQIIDINSALCSLYDCQKKISHKQLYTISDTLYKHKASIDKYLYNRITDMFDIHDKLVIFDLSNTYFETRKADSKIAKHGRSKEKRSDCPLVVFSGVINSQGFIRHSRIYEGNKSDMATISDMIKDLQEHSSPDIQHTVVIDAGIATDDNLEELNTKGYRYVCVSKKRIKDYPLDLSNPKTIKLTDRGKNKLALNIFNPDGYDDTWMYVESEAKRKKEDSMNTKLRQRFEQDLDSIKASLSKKGGTKLINKVWERIGRAKQKHNRVSGRYSLQVEQEQGKAIDLSWSITENKVKDDKTKGVYFIRTNYQNPEEGELWDIYNTIREVEATFRSLKSDLNLRPVHHQNDERIEAHLYLTMLAYQLVNTIRYMLKQKGLQYDWKNIVRIMSTQKIQTIKLPTDKKVMHIRKPSSPIKQVSQIYKFCSCEQTQSAVKKYVVYH
ncbi:MAG: IS1634 family transposase [Mesoflavibacter sp.]|nr:IS1634 family transposase [Mesoflavibacter sp.]